MASDKYAIRRTILRTLHRYYCPQTLNTLLCDDAMILLAADNARILQAWEELTAAEYLKTVPGFPDHRSLAPSVRLRLDKGLDLLEDPFLAGASALR